ncbi:hypothetical protein PBRA_000907, partial [Plasmodiophora brassicae]
SSSSRARRWHSTRKCWVSPSVVVSVATRLSASSSYQSLVIAFRSRPHSSLRSSFTARSFLSCWVSASDPSRRPHAWRDSRRIPTSRGDDTLNDASICFACSSRREASWLTSAAIFSFRACACRLASPSNPCAQLFEHHVACKITPGPTCLALCNSTSSPASRRHSSCRRWFSSSVAINVVIRLRASSS